MIDRNGSREMIASMRKDIEKLKGTVTATHKNLIREMFIDLVKHTPQWSGELAMHWAIEFHGKTGPSAYSLKNSGWERKEQRLKHKWMNPNPYKRGDDPAVSLVLNRELEKIKEIRYNSIVKLVNRMPYATEVERGVGPFGKPIRDVNRLASYGGVAMIGYIDAKYRKVKTLKKVIR